MSRRQASQGCASSWPGGADESPACWIGDIYPRSKTRPPSLSGARPAGGESWRARSVDARIAVLTRQQTALIARATPLAGFEDPAARPAQERTWPCSNVWRTRAAPGFVPERTPTPTSTPTLPRRRPHAHANTDGNAHHYPHANGYQHRDQHADRRTLTGRQAGGKRSGTPTRTPPGHGPTPAWATTRPARAGKPWHRQ